MLRQLLARQTDAREATVARLDHIYGRFRRSLTERLIQAQPLSLPGVRQALERLHDGGMRVAIASGFDRQIFDLVLAAVDWAHLLDTQVCSEDVPPGSPSPLHDLQGHGTERSG